MKRLTRNQIVAFALALTATALAHAQAPALQVAQEGTISATLQSPPGTTFITLSFDNSGGLTLNNPQDRFGGTTLFTPSSQVGTTVTVAPTTPIGGQNLSVFPGGTAILLTAFDTTLGGRSTTGDIGSDVIINANAQVTFGANNTATVTFLPGGGNRVTIGLTNIIGGGGGGGCRT
jgi:hypothetical protein